MGNSRDKRSKNSENSPKTQFRSHKIFPLSVPRPLKNKNYISSPIYLKLELGFDILLQKY